MIIAMLGDLWPVYLIAAASTLGWRTVLIHKKDDN